MENKTDKKGFLLIMLLFVLTIPIIGITSLASDYPTIRINEVCSNNFSILENTLGGYTDYIELYNPDTSAVSLLGWTLYTEGELENGFTFGDIIMEPHSYLLLVNQPDAPQISHLTVSSSQFQMIEIPCALSKQGEILYLRNSANKTSDYVKLPELSYDTVYARKTDGGEAFHICTATPGSSNASASVISTVSSDSLSGSPVFSAETLSVLSEDGIRFPVLSISVPENRLYGTDGIFLPENIKKNGRLWERECQLDFFSAGMNYEFSQKAGLRVQNSSKKLSHLDFKLYARSIYDDESEFLYPFFSGDSSADRLILKNDNTKEHLLLALLSSTQRIPVPDSMPCTLFLNGTCYGEYYLMEPCDEDFIADKYQVARSTITLLEDLTLVSGSEYAFLEYRSLVEYAKEHDLSLAKHYNHLQERIDLESLIDCYAVQIYLSHSDFSSYHDSLVWRSEENDSSKPYSDGKWRYMITGVSCSMTDPFGDFDYTNDTFYDVMEQDSLFSALLENKTFRNAFYAKLNELANEDFSIDAIHTLLSETDYFSASSKSETADFLSFFEHRADYLFDYWKEID